MGKMKEYAQEMSDLFTDGIICEKSNRYGQVFLLMNSARHFRKNRIIRICSYCKRWFDGLDWTDRRIPPGQRSHGACPKCAESAMEEARRQIYAERKINEVAR